jgi:predicted nucleotidyltransferase
MPMTPAILESLAMLEHERGIRVLLAAESGSRAWGFASPDSDFDVRFVYAHPRDWYLRVFEGRDVIERMLPGDLDLSGWDLRKALRLYTRCNVALYEWLGSPIIYREDAAFTGRLRELLPHYFQPAAALHHYLGTARTTFNDHLGGETVRLKKVFYFLRPILACRWIEHTASQPPTAFAELVAADWVSAQERATIDDLQRRKLLASEGDTEALAADLKHWMQQQLDYFTRIGPTLARKREVDNGELDEVMRRFCR